MLGWALTFLVVAIIAGVLGFTGISIVSVKAAQIMFFIFIALFILSAIMHVVRGGSPLQ